MRDGVKCTECVGGRVTVSDGVYADCDNCDASFLRSEIGI